jgi:hypothetical protein
MFDYFLLDRHLDKMATIVAEMDDDSVNARPDLPGANSPYQIVFHCCGMLEWWTRAAILGLPVDRDRNAEFVASGTVSQLTARANAVRAQLVADLESIDLDAPLRGDPSAEYVGTPIAHGAGGALLHVLEELAQHHGHLEITRDLVTARIHGQ